MANDKSDVPKGEEGEARTSLGKVIGGIGAVTIALLAGLARHADDAGRGLMRGGRGTIRHTDDFGRGALRHSDDLGWRPGRQSEGVSPFLPHEPDWTRSPTRASQSPSPGGIEAKSRGASESAEGGLPVAGRHAGQRLIEHAVKQYGNDKDEDGDGHELRLP